MARRAHAYPQVEPTAAALVDATVATAPRGATVSTALRLARRRDARAVALGGAAWTLREDLARAEALGLGHLAARALTRPLPVVEARAPELHVRRHLADGAPLVFVRAGGRALGAAGRPPAPRGVSMVARLARGVAPEARRILEVVGRAAAVRGARAFAVGGLVRDAWMGRTDARGDLDVVVEGDGLGVARELARAVSGTLVQHERFLTASVTLAGATGGVRRIDVATARSERYDRPGALPHVLPAGIEDDLGRRDFTVNAMAVELASGAFELLDPLGGTADLRRRRLRVLHPLSFVEDPTRLVRAARYGARLGLAPDGWTRRCQALALALGPYPALSGQRLLGELERCLAEPRPALVLSWLGRSGALRLLDPRCRFTRGTARRLARLDATLGWAREWGVSTAPSELVALVLVADQRRTVAEAALGRLALTGEPRARILRALEAGPVSSAGEAPSAAARRLDRLGDLDLASRHLVGTAAERDRIEWYVTEARSAAPALSGDDVIALGVPSGPGVARVLADLRARRRDGARADRVAEAAFVRRWLDQSQDQEREG